MATYATALPPSPAGRKGKLVLEFVHVFTFGTPAAGNGTLKRIFEVRAAYKASLMLRAGAGNMNPRPATLTIKASGKGGVAGLNLVDPALGPSPASLRPSLPTRAWRPR